TQQRDVQEGNYAVARSAIERGRNLLNSALRSEEWAARCLLWDLPADLAYERRNGRTLPGPLRGTGAGREGQRRGGHSALSTTSVGSGWEAAPGGGHAQRRHPVANRDQGRSTRGYGRPGGSRSGRAEGQGGIQ